MANIISITANLGADAETKYFEDSSSVTGFSIPVRANKKDEKPSWIKIVAWKLPGFMIADLKKGAKVTILGELLTENWANDQGQPQQRLVIRANRIELMSGNRQSADAQTEKNRNTQSLGDSGFTEEDIPF